MLKVIYSHSVMLHQEAWEALDGARAAGWTGAYVFLISGNRWPYIGLDDGNGAELTIHTQPGYMSQSINPTDINLSYGWNRDILTPGQVKALVAVLETGVIYESPTCPCCGQEMVTVPGTEAVGCPEGC